MKKLSYNNFLEANCSNQCPAALPWHRVFFKGHGMGYRVNDISLLKVFVHVGNLKPLEDSSQVPNISLRKSDLTDRQTLRAHTIDSLLTVTNVELGLNKNDVITKFS